MLQYLDKVLSITADGIVVMLQNKEQSVSFSNIKIINPKPYWAFAQHQYVYSLNVTFRRTT